MPGGLNPQGEAPAAGREAMGRRVLRFFDNNKNIGQLMDGSGNIVARYEYSPFGKQTVCSGAYADANPFRFSSEYYDAETGLVDYNFRYYSPELGRWTSTEPIEEEGGVNLYGMVENNIINKFDILGLLPGWVTCTYSGNKSDTGWVIKGYLPTNDYDSAGAAGGGISNGVIIIYIRTIEDNYSCPCSCPAGVTKIRTKKYASSYVHNFRGRIRWAGVPGTWPPLSLSDAVGQIVVDALTAGIIENNHEKENVDLLARSQTPNSSVTGDIKSDSGIPTKWCLWQ